MSTTSSSKYTSLLAHIFQTYHSSSTFRTITCLFFYMTNYRRCFTGPAMSYLDRRLPFPPRIRRAELVAAANAPTRLELGHEC